MGFGPKDHIICAIVSLRARKLLVSTQAATVSRILMLARNREHPSISMMRSQGPRILLFKACKHGNHNVTGLWSYRIVNLPRGSS